MTFVAACVLRGVHAITSESDGLLESLTTSDKLFPQNEYKAAAFARKAPHSHLIPSLPRLDKGTLRKQKHREKLPIRNIPFNACVARPVVGKEKLNNPKAKEALDKEWSRLRQIPTWDEDGVREWSEVQKLPGQQHVGAVFDICVEKNSELDISNPSRKYKGRVVFQGNKVFDQNWDVAMFNEMSSCPATMQAAKAADAYGLLPGHMVQQADAEQAYTQSFLGGTPTWVRLPKDHWPAKWRDQGWKDPVVPLIRALYGHPDAGGYWEKHCEKHLFEQGFTPVKELSLIHI